MRRKKNRVRVFEGDESFLFTLALFLVFALCSLLYIWESGGGDGSCQGGMEVESE